MEKNNHAACHLNDKQINDVDAAARLCFQSRSRFLEQAAVERARIILREKKK